MPEARRVGPLLRREGLYSSHLAEWRQWPRRTHLEHPESQKPATGSQLKDELARLQRENARRQLNLDHTEKLAGEREETCCAARSWR